MSKLLEYKGYHAKIEYDPEDKILFGKIEGIKDLVNFESNSLSEIETEFHKAVDDYLLFCEDIGQQPDKEYKGNINIRISPDTHKQLHIIALKEDCSLNSVIDTSLKAYVENYNLNKKFSKTVFDFSINNWANNSAPTSNMNWDDAKTSLLSITTRS